MTLSTELIDIDLIEFRNDTDEDINVAVCRSELTGQVYVHLTDDQDEVHGRDTTTVPAEYYEQVEVEDVQS